MEYKLNSIPFGENLKELTLRHRFEIAGGNATFDEADVVLIADKDHRRYKQTIADFIKDLPEETIFLHEGENEVGKELNISSRKRKTKSWENSEAYSLSLLIIDRVTKISRLKETFPEERKDINVLIMYRFLGSRYRLNNKRERLLVAMEKLLNNTDHILVDGRNLTLIRLLHTLGKKSKKVVYAGSAHYNKELLDQIKNVKYIILSPTISDVEDNGVISIEEHLERITDYSPKRRSQIKRRWLRERDKTRKRRIFKV